MGIRATAAMMGLLALALVWIGCGGGGGGNDEVTASSISKAQFIKEADAACKKGEEKTGKDFTAFVKEKGNVANPTEEQFSELVQTVIVSNVEQEIEDIRAVGAPSGDEEEIEAILVAREKGLEEAEAQPKRAVQENMPSFEDASKLAKEYGLEVCASR